MSIWQEMRCLWIQSRSGGVLLSREGDRTIFPAFRHAPSALGLHLRAAGLLQPASPVHAALPFQHITSPSPLPCEVLAKKNKQKKKTTTSRCGEELAGVEIIR